MKILCIAHVEDRTNVDAQVLKQTVQPDRTVFIVDPDPAKGINARRIRIAENHKKLQEVVKAYKPDLVWQIEGDGDLPADTLERLLKTYHRYKSDQIGYISGVEVGRHGLYALGAWRFADDRQSFESLDYRLTGINEADATGFYCLLAPAEAWLKGKATWDGERWGPDVNFGLSLREQGYKILCDSDLHIGHMVGNGIIKVDQIATCNVRFHKEHDKWIQKQLT
jgi:hypothetical protein